MNLDRRAALRVPYDWHLSINTRARIATSCMAEVLFESNSGDFSIVRVEETSTSTDWTNQLQRGLVQSPGWIHWARLFSTGTNAKYGNVYGIVSIEIGSRALALISDFVQGSQAVSWPASVPKTPLAYDLGRIVTITGTNPAAGAEVADTVPTGSRWELIAAEVVLVTSATAANRNTALFIDDAGGTITRRLLLTDTTNQTASLTRTHGWYPGTAAVDAVSVSITDTITLLAKFPLTLPVTGLPAGSNIRTVTTNLQVGDDYGAARYVVREWNDPP